MKKTTKRTKKAQKPVVTKTPDKNEAPKEELTSQKAQEILLKERRNKIDQCRQAIQYALNKHKCTMRCSMEVTEQGNFAKVTIDVKE